MRDPIYSNTSTFQVLPQISTQLLVLNTAIQQGFAGNFYYSVQLLEKETNSSLADQVIIFNVLDSNRLLITQRD